MKIWRKINVTRFLFLIWAVSLVVFIIDLIIGTGFLHSTVQETQFGNTKLFINILIGSVIVGVFSFGLAILSVILIDLVKHKSFKSLIIFVLLPLIILAGLFFFIRFQNSKSENVAMTDFTSGTLGISKPTPTPTPTLSPAQVKSQVFSLVNNERKKRGITPLKENSLLDKSAQLKLNDMITNNYFEHVSPGGVNPWYFFKSVGYGYKYAGENLAEGQLSGTSAVNAWMASDVHREDILASRYVETGVAVANVSGYFTIVQHFGAPLVGASNAVLTDPNKVPSRTGKIISYHDWCNNVDTSVYENEIIVKKSSDGNIYGMTADDWVCYENFLSSHR